MNLEMLLNMVPTWMNEKRFSTITVREGGRRMRFSRARARVSGEGKKDTAVPLCLFFRSVGKQKKEEESKKFCCCFGIVLEAAVVWEGGEGRDGERS